MHAGQLDVTTVLVKGLIREQFPEWSARPVRAVASHGTVNALFRIGDDLVARLPLLPGDRAATRKELEDEADAARRLRAISPYPTPEPIAIGEPGVGYPLPWAVYSWLAGTIAYDADVAGSTAFAEDLARFVLALRAAPTEGRVFTGVNVENASYPISVCAERNAVAAMVAAGGRRVDAVAVVTDGATPTPPCGGCRQCLWEFGPEAVVLAVTLKGERARWPLAELLPHAFGPSDLP
jgi:homotetrameric cytidine deaminase